MLQHEFNRMRTVGEDRTARGVPCVPRMIGESLAQLGGLNLFPCPFEIPSYLVKQHWHARLHDDAGHRWLRGVCSELFMRSDQRRKKS